MKIVKIWKAFNDFMVFDISELCGALSRSKLDISDEFRRVLLALKGWAKKRSLKEL